MKNSNYVIAYISALVTGILLLIFHGKDSLYNSVVIVIGVLIAIPSLVLLFSELFSKTPSGPGHNLAGILKWTSVVASLVGLAFGIWMICSPAFFVKAIIYTLGAILVIVGILQMVCIYQAARPLHPAAAWFIIPGLALAAGVVIILLGADKVSSYAGLSLIHI